MSGKQIGIFVILLIVFFPAAFIYLFAVRGKKSGSTPAPSKSSFHFDATKAEIDRDFHSKVVGVTFKNADGSDRQKIVKTCKPGDDIIFKPTPSKEYPDAIGVFTTSGKQIGNLNADLARELKTKYPTNPMSVTVSNITGGGEDHNYGCNIHLTIYKKQ